MMRMMHIIRCKNLRRLLLAVSVLMCCFSATSHAEERQYKVEAAYLYSFFNYITWPGYSSPQELDRPVICIYNEDPILPYLDYVRGRMASERIMRMQVINDKEEVTGCHILYIRHRIPSRIPSALPKNTLVVFKPDDPLDRGGMIELAEEGDRITVKINQALMEKNGFKISSRLLELAQRGR